ncbi:hypothetical protein SANA_28500 [Gottschalkiaceae bacterium SANA]|nr:hypothetical protein SANA_28500 [Gottschalkiaceae bacterium SANA]
MAMIVESYLKENIDEGITIKPWIEKKKMPIFLRSSYNFYVMTILTTQCIIIEAVSEPPGIDGLQKHIKQIEKYTNRQIVLFYKEITRYRRKSLIQNHIPFVIEDGQMYLPFLGLDLKKAQEHADKEEKDFTISAQVAYLYFLYHKYDVVNVTEFAEKLGFTTMTASRALNDLYHAHLITYKIGGKTGRSKEYKRIPDPDYFLKGRDYMKSPVKKTVYTKTKPQGLLTAGLEALAGLSMINSPDHLVFALDKNQFDEQKFETVKNRDVIKDTQLIEIQLWGYDPKLFSNNRYVDLLSLYASLKEEADERVEQALEEVLRGEPWYMD